MGLSDIAYRGRAEGAWQDEQRLPASLDAAGEPVRSTEGWRSWLTRALRAKRKRIRPSHTALLIRHLATLLDAGLPLSRALRTVGRQLDHPRLSEMVHRMCDDVEGGEMFSSAMATRPEVFDPLMVNVVRAGEAGGTLPETLTQLADNLDKREALRRTVLGAMVYPAIVIVIAAAVVGFLLVFVVPTFEDIFRKMKLELPAVTRALLWSSRTALRLWWVPLLLGAGLAVGRKRLMRLERARYWWDRTVLRLPLFGPLQRKALSSRFLSAFATLIGSGVSIVESLRLMSGLAQNVVVRDAIEDIRRHVSRGGRMSEPMDRYADLFSPMAIQMISVGEETGSLPEAATRTAGFLSREVEARVRTLVTMLEPLMTVGLGMVVGTIVLAIYLPLFDLMKNVTH